MNAQEYSRVMRENEMLKDRLRSRNQHLSALGQDPSTSNVIKEFYTYEEDFLALANGASATGNINIQADSDFVLQKLTYFADIAAAAQTDSGKVVPLCTLLITDTGSGRQLMESAVAIPSLFGSGELPFILPTPRLFLARSSIAITVGNFSAATTYNVRLSLIGYKVYRGITG